VFRGTVAVNERQWLYAKCHRRGLLAVFYPRALERPNKSYKQAHAYGMSIAALHSGLSKARRKRSYQCRKLDLQNYIMHFTNPNALRQRIWIYSIKSKKSFSMLQDLVTVF
jgi:hypothetical protein